jgi:hypothetical protein
MAFRRGLGAAAGAALALMAAAPAHAVPAQPIPEGPAAATLPRFIGAPFAPQPVTSPDPPRHPFMAPNGRSEVHVDAYQTDVHQGLGPLGNGTSRMDTFLEGDCGSVTFDSQGRIVTVCVGVEGPKLVLMDARSLDTLAVMPLPPRQPGTGGSAGIFNDFAGGGYFYLDNQDRAVIPTTTRHVYVVAETPDPGFTLQHDYDVSGAMASSSDKIISALPDWSGRIWFASVQGVLGTIDPASGGVHALPLGEPISNSFAVDDTGGVFVVTTKALYRLDAGASGTPVVTWREAYENSGIAKPGQSDAGSGTTPTLMGSDYVSILDNADPMNVVVYRRASAVSGSRLVCTAPVFDKGASSSDQSLIGTATSMVAENNYGYTGPAATQNGATTKPGLQRVDIDAGGKGCHTVWRSNEIAPTVVPKLSAGAGLVYTYTKDPQPDNADAWYLTAIDFRTGKTVFKALAGEGLGHNNNYAPVTLGPDATAYVGTLGGLVALRDARGPAAALGSSSPTTGGRDGSRSRRPKLALRIRRNRHGGARLTLTGRDVRLVIRADFRAGRRIVRRDRRAPFTVALNRKTLRKARGRISVDALLGDGRRSTKSRTLRARR